MDALANLSLCCEAFWFYHPLAYMEHKSFPANHKNCPLLSHLLKYFGSKYAINMDLDQTASLGSSLIRAHSVCFNSKNILECI